MKKAESKIEKVYPTAAILGANIRALMAYNDTSAREITKLLGITEPTLRRRLNEPWRWEVSQLEKLAGLWGLNAAQLLVKPTYTAAEAPEGFGA